MKRNAILKLVQWKNSPERKPMVLRGARQVMFILTLMKKMN